MFVGNTQCDVPSCVFCCSNFLNIVAGPFFGCKEFSIVFRCRDRLYFIRTREHICPLFVLI